MSNRKYRTSAGQARKEFGVVRSGTESTIPKGYPPTAEAIEMYIKGLNADARPDIRAMPKYDELESGQDNYVHPLDMMPPAWGERIILDDSIPDGQVYAIQDGRVVAIVDTELDKQGDLADIQEGFDIFDDTYLAPNDGSLTEDEMAEELLEAKLLGKWVPFEGESIADGYSRCQADEALIAQERFAEALANQDLDPEFTAIREKAFADALDNIPDRKAIQEKALGDAMTYGTSFLKTRFSKESPRFNAAHAMLDDGDEARPIPEFGGIRFVIEDSIPGMGACLCPPSTESRAMFSPNIVVADAVRRQMADLKAALEMSGPFTGPSDLEVRGFLAGWMSDLDVMDDNTRDDAEHAYELEQRTEVLADRVDNLRETSSRRLSMLMEHLVTRRFVRMDLANLIEVLAGDDAADRPSRRTQALTALRKACQDLDKKVT